MIVLADNGDIFICIIQWFITGQNGSPKRPLQEKYKRLSVNSVLEQLVKNEELFWQNVHHK